ncbi:MAG: hypothetical protein AB9872_00330 [Solidesulfovibrio sp.]
MTTIDVAEQRFTFREAALAAGMTPKTLRNWIDRKLILLDADTDREDDTWRKFSLLDVIRIAFVYRLVGYCVSVNRASELIEDTIVSLAKQLRAFKNPPLAALLISYDTSKFVLYHEGDNLVIEFTPGTLLDSRIIETVCKNSCAFLTIFPGPVVRKIAKNLALDDADED